VPIAARLSIRSEFYNFKQSITAVFAGTKLYCWVTEEHVCVQCTRSCDTGLQHREIKCLDAEQRPSQSCDPDLRPDVRRTCNHLACPSSSSSSKPGDSDAAGRTGDYDNRHLPTVLLRSNYKADSNRN